MSQVMTVMTQREEPGPSKEALIATTKADEPNVKIIALPWWQMIGIRVLRVYLFGVVGFLGTGFAGLTGSGDVKDKLLSALTLAAAPAIMSLLQNTLEILTKLDITNPTIRA